jgi:hypothetical protein
MPTNHTSRHTLEIMIAIHRGTCTVVNIVLTVPRCFGKAVLTIVGHVNMTFASSGVHWITATKGAPAVQSAIVKILAKLAIFQP